MGIFSFSDIVITVTLFVNALALLSSKVPSAEQPSGEKRENEAKNSEELEGLTNEATELDSAQSNAFGRCFHFLYLIRQFSCIIVMWNILFMVLMALVFRD